MKQWLPMLNGQRDGYQNIRLRIVIFILIIQKEIGIVFAKVLEDAGVYKRTDEGKSAFKRFIESL